MNILLELALPYLDNSKLFSVGEALNYADILMDVSSVWEKVLLRNDVSLEDVIKNAHKIDNSNALEKVFKRPDVQEYIKSLKAEEIIDYAKKVDDFWFWTLVLERPDVQEYLK